MKLPEPDTHCFDEDTQKDVWSYSAEQVRELLAQQEAVMRQALEALNGVLDKYGEPIMEMSISGGLYECVQCRDAIKALEDALK